MQRLSDKPGRNSLEPYLLPYQQDWIHDLSSIKVYEKSRRIGITWTESADAALSASREHGTDYWYIGYNKDMALEFVETAAEWARRFDRLARAIEEIVVEDDVKSILAYCIRFASGHKIVALSSRPSNLRGKQGIAIIDEAAFHDDLGGLLKAAIALTMWGGRVHVISTHNGADNPFNQLVTDIRAGRKPYSLHRTTLDDALAQGLYRAICLEQHQLWSYSDEQAWRARLITEYSSDAEEELLCIPSTTGGVFMPSTLIESRMNQAIPVLRWYARDNPLERGNAALFEDAEDWIRSELDPALSRIDPQLMSSFGEDFGRSGDLTVIWPMQLGHDLCRRTPFVVELRGIPFKQQAQVLFHIVDRLPRFIGGAMDARGNGQYLAEEAALRYGARVEQVMLTLDWYRDNMPRYKAAFEDGKIELPQDDGILSDHRMLRMDRGVARPDERRIRGKGGEQRHSDSAIAGALGYYASYSNHQEYDYRPVASAPAGRGDSVNDDPELRDRSDHSGQRIRFRRGAW